MTATTLRASPMLHSRRKHTLPFNWPLWTVAGVSLLLGAAIGYSTFVIRQHSLLEGERYQRAALEGRIQLLTNALKSQSDLVARLDTPLQAPGTTTAAPVATAHPVTPIQVTTPLTQQKVAPVTAPTATPVAAPKPPAVKQQEAKVEPKPQPVAPVATSTPAQPKEVAVPPAPAHTAAATPPAADSHGDGNQRIEGVSMEKAGIAKLWTNAVDFRSGMRIKVGERFPSGERLVSVDASLGLINTDQRQIIITDFK